MPPVEYRHTDPHLDPIQVVLSNPTDDIKQIHSITSNRGKRC